MGPDRQDVRSWSTGAWFPDIMTVAKGLSSAYAPVGAVIATDAIASVFAGGEQHRPFIHALTFGGHPVTTAVALRNIEIIEREKLPENAAVQGRYLVDRFAEMQEKYPVIGHVHAMGLQIGLELVKDRSTKEPIAPEVRDMLSSEMEKRRLLVRAGTIRLHPLPAHLHLIRRNARTSRETGRVVRRRIGNPRPELDQPGYGRGAKKLSVYLPVETTTVFLD